MKTRRERRRHRVYVTRNTEYHMKDDTCIAVRDRRHGSWLVSHRALSGKLSGCVRFNPSGDAYPCLSRPEVGDALFLSVRGQDVITSAVTVVGRPERDVVQDYPL